jgi:hypothetical protein
MADRLPCCCLCAKGCNADDCTGIEVVEVVEDTAASDKFEALAYLLRCSQCGYEEQDLVLLAKV